MQAAPCGAQGLLEGKVKILSVGDTTRQLTSRSAAISRSGSKKEEI